MIELPKIPTEQELTILHLKESLDLSENELIIEKQKNESLEKFNNKMTGLYALLILGVLILIFKIIGKM